ncbi:succinate dehydrogenase assembly factor 2 [Methylomarinum sp. Ch1-1]|uniref:FAD assembly factor SdhE n=1 Tax=Methylomarinum roseum TaxID=3067653 RepID=A0AAU7NQK9_9GAMM|nr:succinate dehydrogenase assembly factor 2 [Methylomarinum sp. Ch1-1]MDP4520795.1 succinate dehydrogenase assembly factor 2 [Methylomarinum sp. Ch1-1]
MEELSKLKWRCRRGTLELDILFRRYLDQCYCQADASERHVFLQLLELEDGELMRYMMGYAEPDDGALVAVVAKMRRLSEDGG